MDFKKTAISLAASLILVIRNFFFLIFFPYKTMRRISQENDVLQLLIILIFIYIYFHIANNVKVFAIHPILMLVIVLAQLFVTVLFFYGFNRIWEKKVNFTSFVYTFSYSFLPTLIWFSANTILYYVLPPPRTLSMTGKAFSIVFVAFSLSLLLWKIILVYLAIRFSSKRNFYSIIYGIILYLCIFLPYSV
ncbi:MAG: hypothetical protein UR15_C0018G0009, partial [Parcubacteria group bacterium GW2011_GWA2_31_28]